MNDINEKQAKQIKQRLGVLNKKLGLDLKILPFDAAGQSKRQATKLTTYSINGVWGEFQTRNDLLDLPKHFNNKDIDKALVSDVADELTRFAINDPMGENDKDLDKVGEDINKLRNEKTILDKPQAEQVVEGRNGSFAERVKGKWEYYLTPSLDPAYKKKRLDFIPKENADFDELDGKMAMIADNWKTSIWDPNEVTKQSFLNNARRSLYEDGYFFESNWNNIDTIAKLDYRQQVLIETGQLAKVPPMTEQLKNNRESFEEKLDVRKPDGNQNARIGKDFIPGINYSYAQKVNGKWQVHANDMALGEQAAGEVGYASTVPLDKLPDDVPVYASSSETKPGSKLEPMTKKDFLKIGKQELEYSDHFAVTKENIKKMADFSFDAAKTKGIFNSSFEAGISKHMQNHPEMYDQLTTKKQLQEQARKAALARRRGLER